MDVVKPNSKKNAQGLVGLASSLLQEQLDLSQGPQTEDALIEVLLSLSLSLSLQHCAVALFWTP